MKDLLNKISSYNIFNYLFPGVLYAVIISKITKINILQEDILVGAFLYYFIGLVISRIGSLLIEPFLKKIKFIKFAEYSDFIQASKDDPKIEVLSESNNTYRTLTSLFFLIIISKVFLLLSNKYQWLIDYKWYFISSSLLIMFAFSYRKQTIYITKRIKNSLKSKNRIIS
ncbi:hypothetical protein [Chondrinema litorale]|uniref:hypothetical protein n=1 Tax=Chondrinema litorale TaxID=2994555 RepID=UPI002543711A|nr:hypothetical protein [Chondrinema litorale]UZR95307.1 hypothetical protein OQ292_05670 [Chondrinema litorale]